MKKPTVLMVLDGWGYREETDGNAIAAARTPTWDRLWAQSPTLLLNTSGQSVGLPAGQMGNSEVGHMCLGAGRVIQQAISRIDQALDDGDFYRNKAYIEVIDRAIAQDKAIHIMGLLSSGGIHSHERHIAALIDCAAKRGANKVYLHAFLDGRDTPPRSAEASLKTFTEQFAQLQCGRIASLVGRYYAMDRDNNWARTQRAYNVITKAEADYRSGSAVEALQAAYARDENDEFVSPTVLQSADQAPVYVQDGDSVIFMNFRADRARQLTAAFIDPHFDHFKRARCLPLSSLVMTTQYVDDNDIPCAFPPHAIKNGLGEVLQQHNKTQLRLAETEKYAHVTFFFSGGREEACRGEKRILVPSPAVATYDKQPAMSAVEVTEQLLQAIHSGDYDAIIVNYANADMVGHSGIFEAAVEAVETLDNCLQRVTEAVLAVGGDCLITADHGNCEMMYDRIHHQAHTQHTTGPVPLVYVGSQSVQRSAYAAAQQGSLADVAPTLLTLMGVEQPREMTGKTLWNTLST